MRDLRPELAEGIGVFFLVLVGGAAILTNAAHGNLGAVGVSLAFAFVIAVQVYAMGHLSGAHFNPAITLAFAAARHFPWRRVPTYMAAQLLGGVAAALALRSLFSDVGPAVTQLGQGVSLVQGWLVEALATFLLAFVIIAVATDRRASGAAAGIAIGLTVGLDALAFGAMTGASMNPARSFGPALVGHDLRNLLLYVTAPVVGAVAGMATYEVLRRARRPAAREALGALGPVDLEAKP